MGLKFRIFITGIYRSGTTLITHILNNHPKIWMTFDAVHFMRFSYRHFDPISKHENAVNLVQEIAQRIKRRWQMFFNVDEVISKMISQETLNYSDIYDLIMKALIDVYKPKAIGWGEKTNVCWGKIPDFLSMFPQGKVIHVVRDPRDILCSFKKMTYEPGYAYLDAAFCALHCFTKVEQYQRTLSPQNYYMMKYENLLANPQKEVQTVCQFLGVEYDSKLLDVQNFKDKAGQWWTGDSSFEPAMHTISQHTIGRWKYHANAMEVYLVEYLNKAYMEKYSYLLSGWTLNGSSKQKLFNILSEDKLLHQRFTHWKRTGEGVEAYPSDPLLK